MKLSPQPKRLLAALLGMLVAVAVMLWLRSHEDAPAWPAPAARAVAPRPAPAAEEVPAPAPRPPADLGAGDSFTITAADGARLPVTAWKARSPRAPVVLFVAAPGEEASTWMPVLRTLRAARDCSLAILWNSAESGRHEPGIPDPAARRSHEQARIGVVISGLQRRLQLDPGSLALVGSGQAAAAVLGAAAADPSVRATAFLSPELPDSDAELLEGLAAMTRRQVFLAVADADARAAPAVALLEARLGTLRLARYPGGRHGIELLVDSRVQSDLVGWLFAMLGPRN